MVGTPPLEDSDWAVREAGEQRISETTIMARKALSRGIFSSMGETSVHRI
jgi:hypothetical protein